MSRVKTLLIGLGAAAALAALPAIATACPGCKEALGAQDPGYTNMVRGYFWSILFMMGMPFMLLGGFSAYMYRQVQLARAREQESGSRENQSISNASYEPAHDRQPVEV